MRQYPLLALALLAGCSAAGGEASNPVTVRDSAGIAIVTNDLARLTAGCAVDSAPTTLIGVAEGAPEYMFHRVFGATQLSDGRIVVVNQGSNEIRYYDRMGKFLMRAGREGQGPGEFSNAFYIWPTRGDTVYVGDYRPWQFLVFDANGAWVRTVRPDPEYINPPDVLGVLQDGTIVLSRKPYPDLGDPTFRLQTISVVVHASNGTQAATLDSLPNGRWGQTNPGSRMWLYPWFESFAHVAAVGTQIALGNGAHPELLVRDAQRNMDIARIVRWTTGDRTITAADRDAERKADEAMYGPITGLPQPSADQLPAFNGVLIGRDGRLWIREYQHPALAHDQRWIGFDSTGSYACRFSIPSSQELLEVGADYLLTKDPDADGVERIARFRLGKPGT
jgi:hypothetical protein